MPEYSEYYAEHLTKCADKIDRYEAELPEFVARYLNARMKLQDSTKAEYIADLRIFFNWLHDKKRDLRTKDIEDISLEDLGKLTADDIQAYMAYLGTGSVSNYNNNRNSIARKLIPINGLYKYYLIRGKLTLNPVEMVERPREPKTKGQAWLDTDDIARILKTIENNSGNYSERTRKMRSLRTQRDYTIIRLMAETGIRISECIGLDIEHINFKDKRITVTRKGGHPDLIYISDGLARLLSDYINTYRAAQTIAPEAEHALFISNRGTRMTARNVQIMVKSYGEAAGIYDKKITPHKLRKAYGTALYKKSGGDIEMVKDVLGHESITTTTRYIDNEGDKKRARGMISYDE